MNIEQSLYRPRVRPRLPELKIMDETWTYATHGTGRITPPTAGERWYAEQCELGKLAAERIKRRMGWGLAGKFPTEALEVE